MTEHPPSTLTGAPAPAADGPARRLAPGRLSLGLIPLIAAGFLAGCGEENAYCVDNNGTVVDNQDCDDEYRTGYYGGHYWAFTGNRSYGRGDTVNPSSQQIAAADRSALASKGGFGSSSSDGGGTGRKVAGSGFGGFGKGSFGG